MCSDSRSPCAFATGGGVGASRLKRKRDPSPRQRRPGQQGLRRGAVSPLPGRIPPRSTRTGRSSSPASSSADGSRTAPRVAPSGTAEPRRRRCSASSTWSTPTASSATSSPTSTRSAPTAAGHPAARPVASSASARPTSTASSTAARFRGAYRRHAARPDRSACARPTAGTLGVEYMHIQDQRAARLAPGAHGADAATARRCAPEERLAHPRRSCIARRGVRAVPAHAATSAQKRFSLEGGETLIPLLDTLDRGRGATLGVERDRHRHGAPRPAERARQRPAQAVRDDLRRVRGRASCRDEATGDGDVKYHLGYSQRPHDARRRARSTCRSAPNPSHLEAVEPGRRGQRARQAGPPAATTSATAVVPLLIHGDAAFAGQGLVAETLNLSRARRLPHRRHDPRHRQQPDRLHDAARGRPLHAATPPTSRR